MVYLMAILQQMNFEKEGRPFLRNPIHPNLDEEIEGHLKTIDPTVNLQEIDFEKFARLIAILLEELNKKFWVDPFSKAEQRSLPG